MKVEVVAWSSGKHHLTDTYAWFLARWARRLSWKEVAVVFHTSWEKVLRSVEMALQWGRAHQDLSGVSAIGIDEVAWQRGPRFLTLVYQIDAGCRRLLWVGQERRVKTLMGFFHWLGPERSGELRFICSDMWRPYLMVIAKKAAGAIHVLDRFHIVAKMNNAIDEVRAPESRALAAKGYEPVLKRTRWLLRERVHVGLECHEVPERLHVEHERGPALGCGDPVEALQKPRDPPAEFSEQRAVTAKMRPQRLRHEDGRGNGARRSAAGGKADDDQTNVKPVE